MECDQSYINNSNCVEDDQGVGKLESNHPGNTPGIPVT